jgi:UV DNA damage endonuclease
VFELNGFRVGFFCSTADGKITTNRKFRLANLSYERVMDAVEKNLEDFKRLLDLSLSLGCGIFRLGSDIVPFASHPFFKREWLKPIGERLEEFSEVLEEYPIRITMHPGQFVVLSSPRKEVVDASLRELEYHFWLLDRLGVGEEGVVVAHVGGVYGSKEESLHRFRRLLRENPWLHRRLAVENDERHYTVRDLLDAELGLPIVFDYYHHTLNPSEFDPQEVLSSWRGRVPEFHLSSRPEGKHRFGEHGDWVRLEDFLSLVHMFGGNRIDLVLEAKQKERAVEKLLRELYIYSDAEP